MIYSLGHKMNKMSPEHFITQENKEITKSNGIMSRGQFEHQKIIIIIIAALNRNT